MNETVRNQIEKAISSMNIPASPGQVKSIRHALHRIAYLELLTDNYEIKEITVLKTPTWEWGGRDIEIRITCGRKTSEHVNTSHQVFVHKRGGLSAYQGPKSKWHGPDCIPFSSRIKIY